MVGSEAIIEVKSIYSASTLPSNNISEIIDMMKQAKKPICLEKTNNVIKLKRTHPYYYQVIIALHFAFDRQHF